MKKIKLFDIISDEKELNQLSKVLKNKFWASGSGVGNVSKFEKKFQKFVNSKSCVAVNSGTAALHLALSLFNIKNKEVILPSISFVSTAHAIIYNGGIPKFVDIDPSTLCLDPLEVKKSITKKTKLILPVHLGGISCDMKSLKSICKNNSLYLVEDAAHATGTKFNGKIIGQHGDAVCFSFHPIKNLAMPSGGAVTLNHSDWKNDELKLKSRRWCGISNRKDVNYNVKELGWNYYMNEFEASIGLIQLNKLHKNNLKRKLNAKKLSKEINLENKMPFDENSSYHFYWIRVKNRKNFMKKMKEVGIETGIHYKPITQFDMYKTNTYLSNTELVSSEIVSLPTHPNLTENDLGKIISYTNEFSQ
tara:strand:- start:6071 stop:7156 length:1086 start_codon:yes stop_codon:yes gene_type:complete